MSEPAANPGNRENESIQAQLDRPSNAVVRSLFFIMNHFDVLEQVSKRVSPDMPADLKATAMPDKIEGDAEAHLETFNYDEGHAGRYSVPIVAAEGGSLNAAYVNSKEADERSSYISSNLTFAAPASLGEIESVLFSPGLNTIHQPFEDETTAPLRAKHYTETLLSVPMCQIHTGTSFDQGDLVIDLSNHFVLRLLLRGISRLTGGNIPKFSEDGRSIVFSNRSIDTIQTVLSLLGLVDTPLKVSFRALLDSTKSDKAVSITLATYSRASAEVMNALYQHIDESKKSGETREQIFDRLRKYVTVMTIGAVGKAYPDGPAYLHLSSWTDQLTSKIGVNGLRQLGAGKDAVFLNCDSPLNPTANDNHNFGSITAPYLSLVLRANNTNSLRELWQLGQDDKIIQPPNVDKTLPAAIVLTNGLDWLWNKKEAMEGVADDAFPDKEAAFEALSADMGTDYAETLKRVFQWE